MPREDFSKVFTIEHHGSKGWEVIGTYNTYPHAIESLTRFISTDRDYGAYRLTTPTDSSIYR